MDERWSSAVTLSWMQLPEVGPDATKEQLVLAVGKHFMGQQIDETRAISMFLKTARQQGDGK